MRIYTQYPYPDRGDRFYVGLDLGQRADYTALAVVRRLAPDGWNPRADATDCPAGCPLLRELQSFRVRVTDAANETFRAWREGDHDDTVLAVAFACWAGERVTLQRARVL